MSYLVAAQYSPQETWKDQTIVKIWYEQLTHASRLSRKRGRPGNSGLRTNSPVSRNVRRRRFMARSLIPVSRRIVLSLSFSFKDICNAMSLHSRDMCRLMVQKEQYWIEIRSDIFGGQNLGPALCVKLSKGPILTLPNTSSTPLLSSTWNISVNSVAYALYFYIVCTLFCVVNIF